MNDAEERLRTSAEFFAPDDFVAVSAEVINGSARPGHGETQALLCAVAVGRIFGALIEGHRDIGAERDLHIHGMFRREEVAASIEMRAEVNSLVGDFAQTTEAEDLEAARVGQHGARPTDKAVQTAHAADRLVSGTQIEVVGVAKNDLGPEGFDGVLGNGFDGSSGADGHEDRRIDGLMGQMDLRAAAARVGRLDNVEVETHVSILMGRTSRASSQVGPARSTARRRRRYESRHQN